MSSNLAEALARRRAPESRPVGRSYGKIDIGKPRPERPRQQGSSYADSDLASRRHDDKISFEKSPRKGPPSAAFKVDTDVDDEASGQAVELARQIFDEADIDNNGKIDQIELRGCL